MKIHHVTIPAHDPGHVASVLAEILGARVHKLPHPAENHLVYGGDADGSAIEVWPVGTRGGVGDADLCASDLPMPERWPHHAYITTTHILERVHPETLVVNDPASVRNAPEKILVTEFADLMPPTLITRDRSPTRSARQPSTAGAS